MSRNDHIIRLRRTLNRLCAETSQTEMARRLGTTQSRISKLLAGETQFSIFDLIGISQEMGVSLDQVIYGQLNAADTNELKEMVLAKPAEFVRSLTKEEKKIILMEIANSFTDPDNNSSE